MKLLVCGGRDYLDAELVGIVLDRIHKETPITLLIQGGAMGADSLARAWARRMGVENRTFEADWNKHGKGAGPIRNLQMLTEGRPDMVVAFPGGRGTTNMVDQAHLAGVIVEHAAREAKDAHAALVDDIKRNAPRTTSAPPKEKP